MEDKPGGTTPQGVRETAARPRKQAIDLRMALLLRAEAILVMLLAHLKYVLVHHGGTLIYVVPSSGCEVWVRNT